MRKISVLVCDDMKYMCMVFEQMLNNSESCECVGMANSEKETLEKVKQEEPDIVLLDMQMDVSDSGIRLIPKIKEISPETEIIIISIHDDNEKIFKAIQLGAKDYLFKTTDPEQIIKKIEDVDNGRGNISSDIAKRILDELQKVELTQKSMLYFVNKMRMLSNRELEVLQCACEGDTYEKIAEKINAEPVTVRTYISRILKKMEYTRMSVLVEDLNKLGIMKLFE